MINDPIVEEIHQVRAKLLAECGDDLHRLLERYRLAEANHADRLVTLDMVRQRRRESEMKEDSGESRECGCK